MITLKITLGTLAILMTIIIVELVMRFFFDVGFSGWGNVSILFNAYSLLIYFLCFFIVLSIFPIGIKSKLIISLLIPLVPVAGFKLDRAGNYFGIMWAMPGIILSNGVGMFVNNQLSEYLGNMDVRDLLKHPDINMSFYNIAPFQNSFYVAMLLWDKRNNSSFRAKVLIKIDDDGTVTEIPEVYLSIRGIFPVGSELILQQSISKDFYLLHRNSNHEFEGFRELDIKAFPERTEHFQNFDGFIYAVAEDAASDFSQSNPRIIRFNDEVPVEVINTLNPSDFKGQDVYTFRPREGNGAWLLLKNENSNFNLVQLEGDNKISNKTKISLPDLRYAQINKYGEEIESDFDDGHEPHYKIDNQGNIMAIARTDFTEESILVRTTKEGAFDKNFAKNVAESVNFKVEDFTILNEDNILVGGSQEGKLNVIILHPNGTLAKRIFPMSRN